MEKQYLVVHEYENIPATAYVVGERQVKEFMQPWENRKEYCFEFDVEKIKQSLKKVELNEK